jgi:acyl-homoserine lactone acylase PvdQ
MVRRVLLFGLLFLILVAVGAGSYLYWAAKRAEPLYGGQVALAGLSAPVTVRYGPHAVPSIEAENIADLMFAQGYVVASERMWQMDLIRRLGSGRLAEVLGEDALKADRFFRTIGLARAASESLAAMERPRRDLLEAYAAGVNAYRDQATGREPVEYLIAGFEPTPWTPEDSLVIGEYMAWTLSFNAREELVFLRLAGRLGNERAFELFPTDEGIPAPLDARDLPEYHISSMEGLDELLALPARFGLPVPGAASNAWAINGQRTADGGALLANDPHLAPSLPGIWYELEMRSPGYHAAGVAIPGIPLVAIGHNEDLAWGFTTVMADTQDIFVERPSADGNRVLRPQGRTEAIASRVEELRIKGQDEPERLTVRSTSHGVIINDILGSSTGTPMDLATVETPDLLALRWGSEVPETAFTGLYELNTARTLGDARRASLKFKHVSQNLMAVHRDGRIAWQVTGLLPNRGRGSGAFPSPGWEPGFGWEGYIPQAENPGIANPPGYALVTANNRTVPVGHPVNLGHAWMAPYRAERIEALLGSRIALSAQDMTDIQLDRVSVQLRRFKDALEQVAAEVRQLDPEARRIADDYLGPWNGGFELDSRSAAFFVLLQRSLFEHLFGDELGEDLPALLSIAILSYNALEEAIFSGRSSFWDDQGTPEQEGPAHIWVRALRSAKAELDRLQPELREQRLEQIRQLSFPHAFVRMPILGGFFGIGPIPVGGDTHTVNAAKASPAEPGEVLFIPSMRVVYTPSDWRQSRGTLTLGQSGHRFSPYRDDQLKDWLGGRYHPWPWNGPAPGSEIGVLVLQATPAD